MNAAGTLTRSPHALSARTQRRVLSILRRRALDGDVAACEALLKMASERLGAPVDPSAGSSMPEGDVG